MEQPGLIEVMAGHRSEHFLSRINPRKDMHHKTPLQFLERNSIVGHRETQRRKAEAKR